MTTLKDRLDLSRRQMLLGFIIGYSAWQTAFLLDQAWHLPVGLRLALFGLGLVGWGYWVIQLLRMLKLGRMLRQQPQLADALNDEYVQQKRWKAWMVAFCAILVCQAAIILINLLAPFDAGIGAQITILVAVVSSVGAFLYFDREVEDA
jgi:hypothetical protein